MLPRVAFEYGQTSWAAATSASAAALVHARHRDHHRHGDAEGAGLAGHRADRHVGLDRDLGGQAIFWRAATAFIAPMKQAE
jgi:hypothetical protein